MHPLDNPVWHALTGPQQKVAEGTDHALRFQPDVAPFAAVADAPSPAAFDDLRDLVGGGGVAVLFVEPRGLPPTWERVFTIAARQMQGDNVESAVCADAVSLGDRDVDDMLALIARAQPGPFARRTVELGDYLGVRNDAGELVAMAGMRMHGPGYIEISAVCTDESVRGRGWASALVRDLVGRIRDVGETPVLHVSEENTGAIRLYETLGFTTRLRTEIIGVRAPL